MEESFNKYGQDMNQVANGAAGLDEASGHHSDNHSANYANFETKIENHPEQLVDAQFDLKKKEKPSNLSDNWEENKISIHSSDEEVSISECDSDVTPKSSQVDSQSNMSFEPDEKVDQDPQIQVKADH